MSNPSTPADVGRITKSDVNELLTGHLAASFGPAAISALRERYEAEHVVPIRGMCPPGLLEAIRREACDIIDRFGTSHELVFEITDNTPRNMTTAGQPIVKEHGPLIDAFYFSPIVLDFFARIAGEKLYTCPYAGEHYVVSRLTKSGDTHGWHWDDYTYGLILVLEAPPYKEGGFVQAVPNTSWDKENPDVHGALISSQVRSYALEPGDAYFIKTNTTMHRVYPVRGENRRTIVNMTLVNESDLAKPMTHETNEVLFGGSADS